MSPWILTDCALFQSVPGEEDDAVVRFVQARKIDLWRGLVEARQSGKQSNSVEIDYKE